jgi:hypothetical protein
MQVRTAKENRLIILSVADIEGIRDKKQNL